MRPSKFYFHILLIDDDIKLNEHLAKLLHGQIIKVLDTEIIPKVDTLDILLEPDKMRQNIWKISEDTLKRLHLLSRSSHYELLLIDYGFATKEAQKILWSNDRGHVTKEDAEGRLLTISDLKESYKNYIANIGEDPDSSMNLFNSAQRVVMRSFASRKDYDILGPVSSRHMVTKGAFPNATVIPIDSRQEFFATDQFYDIYDNNQYGRAFYRHLVGTYTIRIVESEMYRYSVNLAGKMRVKRSVFNIAIFAGSVAVLGVIVQFLVDIGLELIKINNGNGWLFVATSLIILIFGSILLSIGFERLSRSVIRWVGSEEVFD